ncbi:L-rhamnonate dehydratase [Salpingoeca rosetta]|uniref:L-rhamnonate dehydratase n=1 Tax=Salpingoeca rosetta (strain ATCC 50818 / BSB-021) TaxID=946362 RepID=F2UQQ3_SALR5|nr:L-rhamnonate dehydratase [Salpingoeca rosetta]EGD79958.1 L-rhamnonate dehydratase [Salpingoeca rosetta]|eukprot:XP_004988579.1 L-rhamnonate dehydratase [Salpingoeca rosetta]
MEEAAAKKAKAAETRAFPRIKEVRAFVQHKEKGDQGADCHDVDDEHWINGYPTPIAHPMSSYPLYAAKRKSWGINALGSVVVEVESEDGQVGVGVSIGGEPACFIVEHHLSRFVEGQDPRDVELMWDQMYRATVNYGRKGLPLQAISAVDLAIWDLLGKIRNEPVYAMLGGKTKDRLPVYMTCSRPDCAKDLGFVGAKVPCPYGPDAGDEGLRKNVAFFRKWRETVGPEFPLMLDCYMALSVPYAIKLAKELQPYGLKWMEEFLHPDDYDGYEEVKRALAGTGIMLTTAEHEYTRYGFRELIKRKAADVLQPDITWMGGITEARRVVAMAAAHDIIVIPHGSSVYSYHLQYAFKNCPLAEYINLSPKSDRIVPYFGGLFPDEPLPKDGFIDLPDKPGFGVSLDRSRLRRPYTRTGDEVTTNFKRNAERAMPTVAKLPF